MNLLTLKPCTVPNRTAIVPIIVQMYLGQHQCAVDQYPVPLLFGLVGAVQVLQILVPLNSRLWITGRNAVDEHRPHLGYLDRSLWCDFELWRDDHVHLHRGTDLSLAVGCHARVTSSMLRGYAAERERSVHVLNRIR